MKTLLLAVIALSLVGCASRGDLKTTRAEIGTFSLQQAQNWMQVENFYTDIENRVKELEQNQAVIFGVEDANQKAILDLTKIVLPPEDAAAETTPQPKTSEIIVNGK